MLDQGMNGGHSLLLPLLATAHHHHQLPVVCLDLSQLLWCRVRDQASKGHSILLPHVVKDAIDAVAEESKQPALCDCKGAQTLATAQEVAVLGEEIAFALRPCVGVWKYLQVRSPRHTIGHCAAECRRVWAHSIVFQGVLKVILVPCAREILVVPSGAVNHPAFADRLCFSCTITRDLLQVCLRSQNQGQRHWRTPHSRYALLQLCLVQYGAKELTASSWSYLASSTACLAGDWLPSVSVQCGRTWCWQPPCAVLALLLRLVPGMGRLCEERAGAAATFDAVHGEAV